MSISSSARKPKWGAATASEESAIAPPIMLSERSSTGLALLRILVGYLWFQQLFWKLPPTFTGLYGYVVRESQHTILPGYGALLQHTFLAGCSSLSSPAGCTAFVPLAACVWTAECWWPSACCSGSSPVSGPSWRPSSPCSSMLAWPILNGSGRMGCWSCSRSSLSLFRRGAGSGSISGLRLACRRRVSIIGWSASQAGSCRVRGRARRCILYIGDSWQGFWPAWFWLCSIS
jgi:hypothetical protein